MHVKQKTDGGLKITFFFRGGESSRREEKLKSPNQRLNSAPGWGTAPYLGEPTRQLDRGGFKETGNMFLDLPSQAGKAGDP